MSLLLEALKKAEKAKEEAQRRATGEALPAEASASAAATPAERNSVPTRDKLPQISAPLEIVSDDPPRPRAAPESPTLEALEPAGPRGAEREPGAPAGSPPRRGPPPADEAGRATAKKVFEAKFREPNPRMPFYITVGVLGLFAIGTVVYFWYQLRTPSPLVNVNPPRASETSVAVAPAAPSPAAPSVAPAAPLRETAIPGLPPAPGRIAAAQAPSSPAAPAAPIAPPPRRGGAALVEKAPPEEPRLAPRILQPSHSPAVAPARALPQVNPNVQAGYTAYITGDLAKASQAYQEALRDDPGNRDALLGLGAIDVRTGHYEAAEAVYLKILAADPRDADAQAALLALRAGSSDPLATESRVKSLLAADPGAHALNFTLGNQLAQQNRWADAQHEYLKAYAAEPENADFAYNVAVAYDHLHRAREALQYYQRALALARSGNATFDLAAAQARMAELGH